MIDASTAHLLQQLHKGTRSLWFADENSGNVWPTLAGYAPQMEVLSNRFDLVRAAQNSGIPSVFSDWELADNSTRFDAVFLRICKEKAINLHLIRLAFAHLNIGGVLHLAGEKNEGVKTIWEHACTIFHSSARLKKNGQVYAGALEKKSENTTDTGTYRQIQIIGEWDDQPIYSKPGVYGWDKIDVGSALLIGQLHAEKSTWQNAESMLDLGCGYGFLTLASTWLPCTHRLATDNNAAALICMEKNANERNLSVEIVAGDKGDQVSGKFDLVLCNPPFHRGFDVDGDLTRDFLLAAKHKLSAQGTAIFVVNSFIPLEKKLVGVFSRARLLTDTRQFKVLALQH
jgi:16S RNA G1207 methylase RsmC